MDGVKRLTLSMHDIAHLVAGGELEIDELNLILMPGSDLYRISHRVRTRIMGGKRKVVTAKPKPAPDPEIHATQ